MDLGKRQRRKVVYNEAELGRARASPSESSSSDASEFEGDEAAEDEDGSGSGVSLVTEEGTEGKKVLRPPAHLHIYPLKLYTIPVAQFWRYIRKEGSPHCCLVKAVQQEACRGLQGVMACWNTCEPLYLAALARLTLAPLWHLFQLLHRSSCSPYSCANGEL